MPQISISTLSIIIGGVWAVLKFREFLKDKRFTTYHRLIAELVDEQLQPNQIIKMDRQIAIVYELRNFPSYYPVSIRILKDLKVLWVNNERLIKEINLSLKFMELNRVRRIYEKIKKTY